MHSQSESYKKAGVDITAGYEAVRRIKSHVAKTRTSGVLGGLGGFGGMFAPNVQGMQKPVLVSGTDGVGTKLRIAFIMNKHDTVGIDCVAMCVNDILCAGAIPLFFLDYIACGKNEPARIEQIVAGIAEGCMQSGSALIGGETAEMPGFYKEDEYDLAGFAVGLVDEANMLKAENVREGDVLIGIASSGVHSNGFSLVRTVFNIDSNPDVLNRYTDELGCTLGEALLCPTRIYVNAVKALMQVATPHGLCHITGGGLYENVPRMLPEGLQAEIDINNIKSPLIFDLIAKKCRIPMRDMYNTFNMGLGMCAAVASQDVPAVLTALKNAGEDAFVIGSITKGGEGVVLNGI